MQTFIGIDLGTSGCRGCAIDEHGRQLALARTVLPKPLGKAGEASQAPAVWWTAVEQVMSELCALVAPATVQALAVDGTSGTLLLCDLHGEPRGAALMYHDRRAVRQAEQVAIHAPDRCGAHGAGSSLAKWLYLSAQYPADHDARPCHQADWIVGRLCGDFGITDEHNALKLGFDPILGEWPAWLEDLGITVANLPRVHVPGSPVGTLRRSLARRWGLSDNVRVVAGTTDSTAGILASRASRAGQGITSLGSTLVIKVLATQPLFVGSLGVYSHRLGNLWLVGGASNSGGAVLDHFFSNAELQRLTPSLRPARATGLDYYPLLQPGERFPDPDPQCAPCLEPRPASDAVFLQGMLEGMARIEQRGYRVLEDYGAPYPDSVLTVGGGATNEAWTQIRARLLGVTVSASSHREAAYGTALLARQGATNQ